MAQIVGNQVKKSDGTLVTPQQGAWYDAQQYWGNTLSNPGQINSLSTQIGAGQAVSSEVNRQTSVAAGKAPNANQDYIDSLNKKGVTGSYGAGYNPTGAAAGAGAGFTGDAGAAGPGVNPTPTLDLSGIYTGLQESSGINALQTALTAKQEGYNKELSTINDNPFLSEGNRVGRASKLATDFQNDAKVVTDQISQKQADNQMQLQLKTKQFDIDSQAAKDSLEKFNSLLSMGALDNASGQDIANITRSTGLSSSLIASAVQKKKLEGLETSIQSFDDGKEQGFTIFTIDPQGNIVNQTRQVMGQSAKAATQYSSDPFVSAFLSEYLGGGKTSSSSAGTPSISNLWE